MGEIKRQYLEALELTHQMLETARNLDWEALTRIEKERAKIVEDAVGSETPMSAAEKNSVAKIITEMEHESTEIMERVQTWQDHARILLRMKEKPG